jgi:hypothetical protein
MKHYFLVSITIPSRDDPAPWQWWLQFLEIHAAHKKIPEGSQRLADNVWLLERDNGINYLASLISEAAPRKLKHQVLFLMSDDVSKMASQATP